MLSNARQIHQLVWVIDQVKHLPCMTLNVFLDCPLPNFDVTLKCAVRVSVDAP